MVDMVRLTNICKRLQSKGIKIDIISWASLGCSEEYFDIIKQEKKAWLKKYFPVEFDSISITPYGFPKEKVALRGQTKILIDDNIDVLNSWQTPIQRKAINANSDFIEVLEIMDNIL